MPAAEGQLMRMMGQMLGLACALALVPLVAVARTNHHRQHVERLAPSPPTPPSQDAIELATLAPPSRLSTVEQTYGDAAYARRRAGGRLERELRADRADVDAFGGVPYPCEPRVAGATAYACNGVPHPFRYRDGYAFTAGYLSAPQRIGVPPDEQSQVLPPLTGFAWVVNKLGDDPLD